MISHLKLTILSENRVVNPGLHAEQGLSIFVETPSGNLLFDTGQTETFLQNARELNIDLKSIRKVVLSHGHYDHSGGLPFLLEKHRTVGIVCHPCLTNKKYRVYPAGRTDIGVPWEKGDLLARGAKFDYHTHPYEILPDVWISGEISRNTTYEQVEEVYQQRPCINYIQDEIHDDMCLIINTYMGLIILLGCGHAGPVNSIKQGMRITGNKRLYAVVGGMHLQHSPDKKILKIINSLVDLNPAWLVPLHCTGLPMINRMLSAFKNRVKLLNVGDTFELEENNVYHSHENRTNRIYRTAANGMLR